MTAPTTTPPRATGSTSAIFVSPEVALLATPGGVQLYTRELMDCLVLAGFALHVVGYASDMRFATRVRRKLRPRPYRDVLPPDLGARVWQSLRDRGATFVFLNGVKLAPLAEELRKQGVTAKIVLLSYGLESVDFLHECRADGRRDNTAARVLGQQLLAESRHRGAIDHVFCLAPFEAEIERWIGAQHVDWIPRSKPSGTPLAWAPTGNRVGCVSRLDHPPNLEGLRLFLTEFTRLAPTSVRFRLVGAPESIGRDLASQFRVVDYLGSIGDEQLMEDAQTWSCFVHPLFCYACGASTKLAVALGWGIPVVTTPAGARGYIWGAGSIPLAGTPTELAELSLTMLDRNTADAARDGVRAVASSMPSRQDIGDRLALSLLGT